MPIVIDDATLAIIKSVATFLVTSSTAIILYLQKKGYIDIWLTKLFTSTEEISALKKQNGNALLKLNLSDDIIKGLRILAPAEDGTIDEEKAIECLHDAIRWNNRLIKRKTEETK